MFIKDFYKAKKPVISFEIFPPKQEIKLSTILSTIEQITDLNPDFISVTYGAGGSGNSQKTALIAKTIKQDFGVEALAHLTAITSKKSNIIDILSNLKSNGIKNIMALRGDIPVCSDGLTPGDYTYAKDLITEIKNFGGFCIGAAAYPEGHIDCDDYDKNIQHLLQKQKAGAEFFITQLFFKNEKFYNFLNKARAAGLTVPIVPGIMPMLSKGQVQRMIFTCGTSLPSRVIRILHKYENDPESLQKAGIDYAREQILDLISHGVDGVHIYTMNNPVIAKGCMDGIHRD